MAVVMETTLGDLTVDLFVQERPRACLNFLKLCKMKYYNFNLFHTIQRGFIAQTGDPSGQRTGGESIYGLISGPQKRFFASDRHPKIMHTRIGLLSFVANADYMVGSQFFVTLGDDLKYLDSSHCVFGEVMEGLDVLELLNDTLCDHSHRPYKDVRITHTVILEDPFDDLPGMQIPLRSPEASSERLQGGRIAADEDADERSVDEVCEVIAQKEAKARATILEMVGDLPTADIAPPENVLFVCKLNPVTSEADLEIIFSRFGTIVSCEVIKDAKTGNSLQYAFVEFDNVKSCEDAYFKMDNVLIDDRRIHVDFSQSVGKIKWLGKGRVRLRGNDANNDLGRGTYATKSKMSRSTRREHAARKEETGQRSKTRGDRSRDRSRESHRSREKRRSGKREESRNYQRKKEKIRVAARVS